MELDPLFNWKLLALDPPGWGGVLLQGVFHTMQIAVGGYGFGLLLGLFGAIGKLYGGVVLRDFLGIYTTIVRAVPELVLILILYYAGAEILNQALVAMNFNAVEISGLAAGVFVIAVVQGAYSTEVIRGAIQSVAVGQIEAARAFGMPPLKILTRVTVPAMLPFALPGLANLWLIAMKDTALLAVVGFSELTLTTRQAAGATKHYMVFFLTAGAIYLSLTLVSNLFFNLLDRRSRRGLVGAR